MPTTTVTDSVSDKIRVVSASKLINSARTSTSLSQEELAVRAGTSRTAVCAYEAGSKDPRAETLERLIEATGHCLAVVEKPTWVDYGAGRKTISVPSVLPRLEPARAFAKIDLGHHVAWSGKRSYDLAKRDDRRRAYEIVLAEGLPGDIESVVDGALLVDLWSEMFVGRHVREAWQPLINAVLGG
jgi:transcriptional regulator with XRE-family HTH domain